MKKVVAVAFAAIMSCVALQAQIHPSAEARRFSRGIGNAPKQQSFVIPADQQRGVPLAPSGNYALRLENDVAVQWLPWSPLPWFCRIQRAGGYHINSMQLGNVDYEWIDNPIAAFGEQAGGTPLYLNRNYRFGVYAGGRSYADALNPIRGVFRIRAYLASAFNNTPSNVPPTNVAPADETTFELPWPGDANWNQFLLDGAKRTLSNFRGLETTIEIAGRGGDLNEQWKTFDDPFVVTHRASTPDYFFVVEYKGWTVVNGVLCPMARDSTFTNPEFSPLYALDFSAQQPWRSTFIHAPQFSGEAVPSWYYGKSLEELQGAWSFNPGALPATLGTPGVDPKMAKSVDHSAELRSHPSLDEFVTSMGSDPIALANYVFNEIELTDPVSYNENGGLDEASINCGGLNRGALATFLEGQGNPWEQCALLVYLLRKANVAAVYCEPEKDKLGMLDTQLSKLLRMQIRGAQTPDGSTLMPTIVPTNYPWVAAYVPDEANPGQNKWVHLFPWLKDTEVIEGGNLYDQFPAGTKTGVAWVQNYIQGDPYDSTNFPNGIVPEQVAAYQESGGIVSIEAEGYHEHVPRGSIRWESLDTGTPPGYSGASWVRAMPNSGANITTNITTTASRLDYKVNFASGTTSYLYVRGYAETTNDNTLHVGLNGNVLGTVTAGGTGAWVWAGPVTVSHTAGMHTVNLWMAKDGFRVDKVVLTTNVVVPPTGTGPAVSKQPTIEANVPSNLFPLYARRSLGANTSFDDLGMRFRDRRYYRTTWDDFPRPFNLYAGSHQTFEKLADRANTFDTVRVQLWSDRPNGSSPPDGIYTAGVDGPYFDTGEWLSTDLHNRRFYTSCRTTGPNTHQLRLYLGPYRSSVSGTGNFSGTNTSQQYPSTNPLQEQLLTANLASSDDALQFEITRKTQKRAWKVGVVSIDVTNQGSGYAATPTVSISAAPAGTYNRNASATAIVSGGKIVGIDVTDSGSGYLTTPTVIITGGGGSGASAKANLEDPIARWTHPLGIRVEQLTTQKPSIRKGELAAICLNFGRVSDSMLRAQAEDFWSLERSLQTTPTLKDDVNFQEKMQSTSAYLMGLSYYNRVSRWKETDERLHKARVLSMYAAGLSKLAPYRDSTLAFTAPTFGLPNGGDIIPRQATVDMFFLNAAYASNGSVHPDSGLPFDESTKDFWHLLIAEISAQEHAIINDYYKESAAISTIKLLHRARTLPAGIRRLTKANYTSEGNISYAFGSGTPKALKDWDPSMWSAITAAFSAQGGDYAEVFVTPGPVASASAAYTGMGAMVFADGRYSALISGNMGLTNGGSGSWFSAPYYSAPSLPSITLTSTSNNYSISLMPPISVSNPVVAPASTSFWNIGTTASYLSSSSYVASSSLASSLNNSASMLGLAPSNLGTYFTETASRGSTGATSYFGGAFSNAVSTVAGWVSDPVNVITGEFHIDAADLTLPGPMPLQIRRNYSSSALSDNEFGYGWKLAYFPYLVVGDVTGGSQLIYGAEMDGSVIAYRRDTVDPKLFLPNTDDNPSLKNLHNGGVGSTGNPLNNRIVTNGSPQILGTICTLTGPNGQKRIFTVREYPVGPAGAQISRKRPYLDSWQDANGNTLSFQFENNAGDPEFGLLKRIGANNGNFVGFSYDAYGHIVEAFTGDGRRVKYSYDAQGDLRTVTLPDGAAHAYDYEQEAATAGGESVQISKHLLVRETKPGGRILENVYHADGSRRVVTQKAVVDSSTPNPVTNATFTYANSQNNSSGDPNYKTWTGTTTVLDAYNRATVFSYTHSLVTSEDDPETPAELREWYPANATPGLDGAFPRSLKKITDRRGVVTFFKYDARGNLVEKSIGTDASPADLDGDGIASAGEKAVTSWTYVTVAPWDRVEKQTDPSGVVTKWFYEDPDYPYLATRIEKHVGGQLVSKTVRAFYEKLGPTSAYGLLLSERVAADSGDEAQVNWEHDNRGFATKKTSLTGTADPAVVVDLVHNLRGELIEEKDTLNRRWKYNYDAMGRRTWAERRDAANNLVSWDYTYFNLNGEVEWTDGPRYNPEDYTWARHDGHGRRTEEIRWRSQANGAGTGVEAPVGDDLTSTTFFKYDKFNNLLEIRTPRRHSVWMNYDQIGRMTGRRYFDGYAGSYAQAGSKATESFTYEPGGEIATHTSVLGGTSTMLYNARGQLRQRTNTDGSVEDWRYHVDGRIYREYLRHATGTLGSYWETTYVDSTRVVTRCLKAGGGTTIKTQVKGYDRRGNCITETADGHTFTKTYDDLNRLKTVTGPAATATSAQQVATYSYPDGAGRETQVVSLAGEKTITQRDALGRVESAETRDGAQNPVRKTSYSYSADHHKTTVTEGSGVGAIVSHAWTDTFGQTVLAKKADNTSEWFFYDNGGLLVDHFDRALRETFYARNWRGDVTQEVRPGGGGINYVPDAAGNILQRNMPGGLSEQAQFDTAGRMQWSKLVQGGTTRLVNYAYYPAGHQWAGLLNTATDARNIETTYGYDAALRTATQTSTGPDPEDALSRTLGYNERDQLTSIAETGLNGATTLARTIDGYGAISTETVSVGGTAQSALTQSWNAAGRRSQLDGAGAAARTFGYRADGLMLNTIVGGNTYAATYGDNGLLATRTNPFRSVNVQTRDSLGRITDLRTTVGGVLALKETVSGWWAADKIFGLYSDRTGAGSWDENRDFGYDNSGRLVYENYLPWLGFPVLLNYFGLPLPDLGEDLSYSFYDGGSWATTGGLGVRTHQQRYSDILSLHQVPAVATFGRVLSENVGGSQSRSVPINGKALGADTVKLTLDSRDLTPVNYSGWQDSQGDWSAAALLAPGYHYLTATATHPSGWVAPAANSSFQVLPRAETLTNGYDEMGNVATRTWNTSGKAQTLTWDARGRLVKVIQTGVNPFTWTALYDGLDRRIKTTYTPNGGAAVTTNSVFDPQVEFLELGLAINGTWNWKVYGPDLSESYGGLQGLGGLEAVIGSDAVTRGIVNDWNGNAAGHVAAPNAALVWNSAQFLAWGPAPGWSTQPLDGSKPLHELLGYRGLTVDPPGYVQQGLRAYDPVVGRWLSPDPLGHAGSLSLYDYCDNDPINIYDPDGRFGKAAVTYAYDGLGAGQALRSIGSSLSSVSAGNPNLDGAFGAVGAFPTFVGNAITPSAYVNTAISGYQSGGGGTMGVFGAINSFNPFTPFNDAITGTSIVTGQRLSGIDRLESSLYALSTAATFGATSLEMSAAKVAAKTPLPKCFAAGTDVETPDGEKDIETIKAGDTVYAYDFETGAVVERRVLETVSNFTHYWADVEVAGDVLHATRGHKFWVESANDWIEAAELKPGMVVRLSNGAFGSVLKVTVRALAAPETTYNLIVEGEHNYFVGDHHVLVHNGYPESPQYPPATQAGETFQFNFDTSPNYRNSRAAGVDRARALGTIGPTDIGHHINSVQTHPHLAAEPSNIAPESTRASHLQTHGGNWRNPTTGPLNAACP